jgi:hypothetical protein
MSVLHNRKEILKKEGAAYLVNIFGGKKTTVHLSEEGM